MNIHKQMVLFFMLALYSAAASTDEPPDDDIVIEQQEEQGFLRLDLLDEEALAQAIFTLKSEIVDERVGESGAMVLKITEHHPFAPNVPPIVRYIEFRHVLLSDGIEHVFERPMSNEEAQRREMEASSLSAEQMAQGLKAYAAGAMVLGEALRQEMQDNPFGSYFAGELGSDNVSLEPNMIKAASINGDWCQSALDTIGSHINQDVSNASESDREFDVKSWTSINPAHFMMGPACMALFAADVFSEIDGIDPADKERIKEGFKKALEEIEAVGIEEVNGHASFRLRIDDANLVQSLAGINHDAAEPANGMSWSEYATGATATAASFQQTSGQQLATGISEFAGHEGKPAIFYYEGDGQSGSLPLAQRIQAKGGATAAGTVAIHSIDLWIDAEYFVDRKLRMEGVMTENGQSRDVFLEQEWQDYRNVPNSALYEPYKRVMRAGGILTEAQQAELAEAQTQLAQYEREMASMPAAERAMVESMMGGQIEQMRNMVNGGAVEIEIITTSIEINPDFHNPMYEEFAREMGAAPVNAGGDDGLLQVIQVDLSTLGYEPGNTKGVLDTMTQVAISQFQAESGLQVTGEPSTALAAALATAVGRK